MSERFVFPLEMADVCVRAHMHAQWRKGVPGPQGGLSSVSERNSYETGMACYLLSKKVRKMDKIHICLC